MADPQYSRTITLGSILSGTVTVLVLIAAFVGWGVAYGALASGNAQNARDTAELTTRVSAIEASAIETGKLLVEVRSDVGYLRRYVEQLVRQEATVSDLQ